MSRKIGSLEEKQTWMRDQRRPGAQASESDPTSPSETDFDERHFTPAEIAEMWHLSKDAVRKLFEHEPGVLVLGQPAPGKRRYTTLRIPQSVVERVHTKMRNPELAQDEMPNP